MRDGGELWAIALRVVVELKQWDGQQFHVLRHREYLWYEIAQ